ncbi:MAG: type II toxin-antitoxin system VapC family toxin [Candidatus Shapirobacteria bacterium]
MIKVYLDANILISLEFDQHPLHQKAIDLLLAINNQEAIFYLSALTLDEYWHSLMVAFGKKPKELEKLSRSWLALPNFQLINLELKSEVVKKTIGLINDHHLHPRDAFHLMYCLENKIDILATFDKDLLKIKKIAGLTIMNKSEN